MAMITSPKVIATPTWPSACVFASTITAPAPANTSAKVPIASATSARASGTGINNSRRSPQAESQAAPSRRLARLARLHDRAVHPICDPVRELDRHVLETRRLEPGNVLRPRKRARDAADIAAALGSLLRAEVILGTTSLTPTLPPGLK